MRFRELLARDPESRKWRYLRAEYDRLEALGHAGPGWRVQRGELWRAMPSDRRSAAEGAAMASVPTAMRDLVDSVIDGYARFSDVPAYAELGRYPVVGFVDVDGTNILGTSGGAYVTLRIDPILADAPAGFARVLAAHAAVSAPGHVLLDAAAGRSTWPSRSAMARLRRLWATTGDYPAPSGWSYVARTLLANAYWRAGIDHRALQLSGERMTEQMASWADARPHPHDPRYYPSWRGRYLAQEQDAEIFPD